LDARGYYLVTVKASPSKFVFAQRLCHMKIQVDEIAIAAVGAIHRALYGLPQFLDVFEKYHE
jgi:hypothetical protein